MRDKESRSSGKDSLEDVKIMEEVFRKYLKSLKDQEAKLVLMKKFIFTNVEQNWILPIHQELLLMVDTRPTAPR